MRIEEVHIVVQLFLDRGPVGERLGDRMLLVNKGDGDGLLWAVASGLQAEVLEPLVLARAEAVHGAVQMHGGDGFVHVQDALQHLLALLTCGALVVNDDVVALGPVGIVVKRQGRRHGFVVRPHDIDLHIGAALDALAQDVLLFGVIMAAASSDEQGFQRLGFGVKAGTSQQSNSEKDDDFFHGKGAENTKPRRRSCNRESVSKLMN